MKSEVVWLRVRVFIVGACCWGLVGVGVSWPTILYLHSVLVPSTIYALVLGLCIGSDLTYDSPFVVGGCCRLV